MHSLAILAFFLVVGFAVQAALLLLAARACRLERRTSGRAVRLSTAKLIVECPIYIWLKYRLFDDDSIALFAANFLLDLILTVWLLRIWFGGSMGRRIGTWAVNLAGNVLAGFGLILLIKIFVMTFLATASSMSPNIRGYHVVEILADGSHFIVPANDPSDPRGIPAGHPTTGIVAETFESRDAARPKTHANGPDRFMCNRTRQPRRWDAVCFLYPLDPSITYVNRLLGLPGEKLEIRDGFVWIDGVRQSPPDRLGQIRYSQPEGFGSDEMQPTFKVTLGPDEFFFLGDNTKRSSDSRIWGPVSREFLLGVVDAIYWPPSRWKLDP